MNFCKYVDVFYGNLEPNLLEPDNISSKWFFLKAQVGNTLPAAVLPFGAVSACAYTAGYPTGYGPYLPNSFSRPKRFLDVNNISALGFSHFHQSGTGDIGEFYNYSVITPVKVGTHNRFQRFSLSEERGSPDYYACNLGGVKCEASTAKNAAIYNFEFDSEDDNIIVFDAVLNGIFRDGKTPHSPYGQVLRLDYDKVSAVSAVKFSNGITLFTSLAAENTAKASLTDDKRIIFSVTGKSATVRIGFSFKNHENAAKNLRNIEDKSLDDIKAEGEAQWNTVLGKIKIQASEDYKVKFYSNLYRCFVKPVELTDENGLDINGDCYADFATMWDVSKTHLPLLFTLLGDVSSGVVNSFINSFEKYGRFPNSFLLCGSDEVNDNQARALMVNSIYDAFIRGIKGVDYHKALKCMIGELEREENGAFFKNKPVSAYPSHTIDLAIAAYSISCLADALGEEKIAEKYLKLSENWRVVYSKRTGMVKRNGEFYEGCNLNYSFRLLPDMEKRIALCGSRENFANALDDFFGFNKPAAEQCVIPDDSATLKKGAARRGFEGFNNETDMETPYCYAYIGQQDKLCKIIRSAEKYLYGNSGTGALCGNEDSGALSSLYVVNSLGFFSVFGQNKVILGSPSVEKSEIELSNGNILKIIVKNFSNNRVVPKSVYFNGKKLTDSFITAKELMAGGEIIFEML